MFIYTLLIIIVLYASDNNIELLKWIGLALILIKSVFDVKPDDSD